MPCKSLQDSSLGTATLCSADSAVSNPSSCARYEQVLPSLVRTAQGIAGDNFFWPMGKNLLWDTALNK